jgi:hypothetical protein
MDSGRKSIPFTVLPSVTTQGAGCPPIRPNDSVAHAAAKKRIETHSLKKELTGETGLNRSVSQVLAGQPNVHLAANCEQATRHSAAQLIRPPWLPIHERWRSVALPAAAPEAPVDCSHQCHSYTANRASHQSTVPGRVGRQGRQLWKQHTSGGAASEGLPPRHQRVKR